MVPHPHGSLPGLKVSGEVLHIQGQGIPEHSSCTSVLLSPLEEGLLSETSLFPAVEGKVQTAFLVHDHCHHIR